jgi:outer membrane protein assembly factor BamE (lipoprotein component of BamABCDE complex)
MRRTLILAAAALLAAVALAGCGERPQTISYKQGTYQGKPDARPAAAQFNGNQQQWENEIKTRNQVQNEYRRIQ